MGGKDMLMMIVDDEENTLLGLRDHFEDCELVGQNDVLTMAFNGKQAQAIIQQQTSLNFEIVITDINMPEMDGIQLTSWIKENFPTIIVILISSEEEPRDHKADAFVSKSRIMNELVKTIKQLVPEPGL